MIRRIVLPTIFALLAYGFWMSPDFKEIAAGVSIFLFGMIFLEEGFKAFTGGILEKFLTRSTNTLWKSLTFGTVTTTFMQSSSLVSVITISFLSAGLITLVAGIGIIFGANIGTTTGAWLVAAFGLKVKISAYAMPMLVFGIILVFQNSKNLKGIGYVLAGMGFLFLGIHYMKEGFSSFKETIDLAEYAIIGFKGLLVFTGIGVFATVVMQSSHATLVLIITALAAGQVTYENALALAIGANIGTTITAILGSLSANIAGKRLAAAHLIFNVITGLIAIVFIKQFLWGVETVSAMLGIAADDHTLKLAVFHTLFNTVGVLVMIPFITKMADVLTNKLPSSEIASSQALYLNDSVLELPDTALKAILNETHHLFENALELICHGLALHRHDLQSEHEVDDVIVKSIYTEKVDLLTLYQQRIKSLYGQIIDFATRAQSRMSSDQIQLLYQVKLANRDIVEVIKDTQDMQANVLSFVQSDNEYIRSEYHAIRVQIAKILRTILHHRADIRDISSQLKETYAYIEDRDIVANGTLDRLIRNGLITDKMATSLMNDSAFAYDICIKLLDMATITLLDVPQGLRIEDTMDMERLPMLATS
ncbi:MAG: Na/Pi cotransporter family protein [Magnetococcales bacterium]|nr:Na/Pi cotransporter family protein [Magnetococcales bacterium]